MLQVSRGSRVVGWAENRVLRRAVFAVAFIVCAALLIAGLEPVEAWAAPRGAESPSAPVAGPTDSKDPVDFPSAAIRARATGQRVEVTAERSESSTTWVNPDGSVTTEQFAAPVRFKNDKGEWASFNTDLVEKADGSLAPASVPEGVVLAGEVNGTDAQPAEVASLSGGAADSQIAVTWPDTLGAPRVEGSTATYAKAWPGIDLRVTATRDGFEQSFIIADRTAAEAYAADQSGSAVTWDVPLSIPDGVTAREIQGERVEFVDSAGNVVSRFEAPMAWDAFVDAKSQEHTQHAGVGVQLVDQTSDGVTLRLSVDRAWLLDSARVFPVTVDPVYASASARPTFDAFVQSNISSDRSSEQELKVGTYDGRAKARSFLTFSTASFKGVKVQSASLKVWESWSYSCTPKPLEVWSTKSVASAAMRWSSQPALASRVGSVNVAKGHSSSCAAGWVSIPITSVVQSWSTSSAGSASLALKAASETDVNGWKRFASMESTTPPSIVFTYDRKPNVAAVPTVAGTATYGADTYVASKRPVVSTTATDPDGNSMRANIEVHTSTAGTTDSFVTKCATGLGASGSTLSCTLPADLPDNKTLYVRAKVVDELSVWSASWSGWKTIKTAQLKPAAPTITCQGYTNGSWVQSPPSANVPCTITVPSLGGNNQAVQLDYRVDGNTAATAVAVTAGKSATMSLPKSAGGHQIRARVYSASRMQSDAAVFTIGWGGPALYSPSRLEASNGAFNVLAKAPPRTANETTVSARMQWRMSGSDDPWTNAGAATPVTAALGKETVYSGTFDAAAALAAANKTSRGPVRMDFQVCFTYSGVKSPMCTGTVAPTVVVRVPHAFGDGYPTTDVETGQVALYTGEFQTSDTDVTVPGYGSDITLSRSHLSFTGSGDVKAWPVDPVTGVFGPGFTANLEGDDSAGLAGVEVIDQRMSDGSIALMGEDGDALVFVNPSGKRETVTGTLVPGTTDTELSGVTAKITGTAAAPTLVVTESDGTVTTFQPASGGAGKNLEFRPVSIAAVGDGSSTTFGYDATTGVVTRIVAPLPDGLPADSCPPSGVLQPGCRALDLTYQTVTDPNGKSAQRLVKVSAVLFDPASKQMVTTPVTTYTYDSLTRLSSVTDVRSGLKTTYTWDGSSTRLKTITPSGLAGYTMNYAPNPDASIPTMVVKNVQREGQTAGAPAVQVASIVYDIATSGDGLPDLSREGVKAWVKDTEGSPEFEAQVPVKGYAVFDSDHPVNALVGKDVSAADLQYASLSYINADAYTINTATFGAGAWQMDATWYDTKGNVVRTLDEDAVNATLADPRMSQAQVDDLSTQTFYNSDTTDASGKTILPAGSRVEQTFGPARDVMLNNGSTARVRPHSRTIYDEGAPNSGLNAATGQPYSLATTVVSDAVTTGSGPDSVSVVETVSTTKNGYNPIDGSAATSTTSGWTLGTPTTVTDNAGRVTKQAFDARGKVVTTIAPASNGADAGTTRTIYYTAGANTADASCGGSDQAKAWAGEVCRVFPAAAPSEGPSMPSTRITGYDYWLAPTTTVETSGSATRTSSVTYDAAGRAIYTKTSTSGLAGSVPMDAIFTQYNPATGLVDAVGVANSAGTGIGGAKQTYTYDAWGKQLTSTNQLGDVTTTTYDAKARVTSINDGKGVTSFEYDGTDANGKEERRGLVTKQTVTRGAGTPLEYRAAYDATGTLTTETLPAGITARHLLDEAGEEIGLSYSGQLTDPDTGEVTSGEWIAWSQTNDVSGRVRTDTSTFASQIATTAGVTPEAEVTQAVDVNPLDFDHRYSYDKAGNLAKVEDLTKAPEGENTASPYVVREYTFTAKGARASLKETIHADGTPTGTVTAGKTQSLTYDTADRSTGGYVYDLFGRQTKVPAAHTPNPGKGNISLAYFDSDLPHKITQGDTTTTFDLDVLARRLTQTTTTPSGVTTTTRHYADDSDNPAWVDVKEPNGIVETTRFAGSISGDLGATIKTDGAAELTLPNIRGDIVTTIPIAAETASESPAETITGWAGFEEYGTPVDPEQARSVAGPLGYGWLGAKERSTTDVTAGLTLMGVRLYNQTTGNFTSADPVPGGNATAYNYPTDPINQHDISGACSGTSRVMCPTEGGFGQSYWGPTGIRGGRSGKSARVKSSSGRSKGGKSRSNGPKKTAYSRFSPNSRVRANKYFNIPAANGVYTIHYKNGKIYVGRSVNMYRRIGTHQRNGKLSKNGGVLEIEFKRVSGGYKRTRITENGTYHHYKNRGYNMENKIRPCRYRNCR